MGCKGLNVVDMWSLHLEPCLLHSYVHVTLSASCVGGLLSYPTGPACWRSGCLSSGSGTSPSRPTWSEADRGRGARPEISEKNKNSGQKLICNGNTYRVCPFCATIYFGNLTTAPWSTFGHQAFLSPMCFGDAHLISRRPHLEGLSVLALPSPLSEKSLLFLLLFLLLQSSDVLFKTNEGILFVHICQEGTTLISGEDWEPSEPMIIANIIRNNLLAPN